MFLFQTNSEQWSLVFYISAAMFLIGNIVFIIFGSTDVQPWNNSPVKLQKTQEGKPVSIYY